MKKKQYEDILKRHEAPKERLKNASLAFLCGGVIGLLAEIFTRLYMLIPDVSRSHAVTYMIITFIFIASLCTALGFFDKLVSYFRAGLIIPITGFAHAMTSSALDYKKEGPIYGIGMNIFKLTGSVILYGVISAWFFGMIRYLIGGGV